MQLVPNDRLLNERYLKKANQNTAFNRHLMDIIRKHRVDDLMLSDEQLLALNYEDLLEVTIGVVNPEIAITCGVGEDFNDESDAKCVIARRHGNGYSGAITGITSKNGALRVVVYEGIRDCFYYFYIPLSAYEHLTCSIEIPFSKNNGAPKGNTKWWKYYCPKFEVMATTNIARQRVRWRKVA